MELAEIQIPTRPAKNLEALEREGFAPSLLSTHLTPTPRMPAALDFLASSDEEEAPRRGAKQAKQQSAKALKKPSVPRASRSRAASDSSDDSPDISSALLASSSSSSKGKAAAAASASASAFAGSEDEDDGLFIAAATTKHNKRAGTELARDVAKSQGKGKNKTGGGTVAGGGSFQSMGELPV